MARVDITEGQALWQPGGVCWLAGCFTSKQHASESH